MHSLSGPAGARLLAVLHDDADPAAAWTSEEFARLLSMPGTFAIAAADGFVLARTAADEAEILMLSVAPAARRRGLGRRLLAEAIRQAGETGASAMFLEVAETNRAARGLYGAAGFAEVGRRPRYYPDGTDALILRRDIAAGAAPGPLRPAGR